MTEDLRPELKAAKKLKQSTDFRGMGSWHLFKKKTFFNVPGNVEQNATNNWIKKTHELVIKPERGGGETLKNYPISHLSSPLHCISANHLHVGYNQPGIH